MKRHLNEKTANEKLQRARGDNTGLAENIRRHRLLLRIFSVCFWLLIWQLISVQGRFGFFLASPLETARRFLELCLKGSFYQAVWHTSGRIIAGFLAAVAIGTLLAALTSSFEWLDIFLMPVMRLIRTVPVVSFIILALILVSSKYLTQLISFIMAMPVVYTNMLTGLMQTDDRLDEMARLYGVSLFRRIRYLYLPQIMPAFINGTALAFGFAWKSGIAAEVIGMPSGSVGERLQQAKVYLDTPDLFAWTLTVVIVSIFFEKIWRVLLARIRAAACRMPG